MGALSRSGQMPQNLKYVELFPGISVIELNCYILSISRHTGSDMELVSD